MLTIWSPLPHPRNHASGTSCLQGRLCSAICTSQSQLSGHWHSPETCPQCQRQDRLVVPKPWAGLTLGLGSSCPPHLWTAGGLPVPIPQLCSQVHIDRYVHAIGWPEVCSEFCPFVDLSCAELRKVFGKSEFSVMRGGIFCLFVFLLLFLGGNIGKK